MASLWMGPFRPGVILFHPDPIKDLLKTAEPKVMRSNAAYSFALPWLVKRESDIHSICKSPPTNEVAGR